MLPLLLALHAPAYAQSGVQNDIWAVRGWGPTVRSVEGTEETGLIQIGYARTWQTGAEAVSMGLRVGTGIRDGGNWGATGLWNHAMFITRFRGPLAGIPYATAGLGFDLYIFVPLPTATVDLGVRIPLGPVHLNLAGQGRVNYAYGDDVFLAAGPVVALGWGPPPEDE